MKQLHPVAVSAEEAHEAATDLRRNYHRAVFRHFRGNEYDVVTFCVREVDMAVMVVYAARGDGSKIWTRPAAEFFESVKRDDYDGPRFHCVSAPNLYTGRVYGHVKGIERVDFK